MMIFIIKNICLFFGIFTIVSLLLINLWVRIKNAVLKESKGEFNLSGKLFFFFINDKSTKENEDNQKDIIIINTQSDFFICSQRIIWLLFFISTFSSLAITTKYIEMINYGFITVGCVVLFCVLLITLLVIIIISCETIHNVFHESGKFIINFCINKYRKSVRYQSEKLLEELKDE